MHFGSRIALLLFLPLAAVEAAPREKLGFDPRTEIEVASATYFAPENEILFRMRTPDGSYREFQRNFDRPNALWSVRGWRGTIAGDRITVRSGPEVEGGPARFVFDKGRLVSFEQGSVNRTFAYDAPRLATAGGVPYVFGDSTKESSNDGKKAKSKAGRKGSVGAKAGLSAQVRKELGKKWKRSGRLRWPFENPNENGYFYLSLAFLFAILFHFRSRAVKVVGGVLFAAACGGMVMAASRGAFLAFALGAFPTLLLWRRQLLRSRAAWALAAAVLLLAVAWFVTHDSKLLTRGFDKRSRWSNETRLEMWGAAPKMMAESPGGWGELHVGRSFMDWYQGLDEISLPGSLINDHLTKLVGYGHAGRFLYLFAWIFGLSLLAYTALRTRRAVALGLLIATGTAAWFNPLLDNVFLLCVPVLVGLGFFCGRPWRYWRWKPVAVMAGVAALLSAVGLVSVYWAGGGLPERGYPVRAEAGRVYVKGDNPKIWIADDGKALGGVMACKDIRGHYARDRHAAAVGYVRDVKNLPRTGIQHLVLAGDAGDEWLQMMSEGGAEAQKSVPEKVTFITPPFPPSALPEAFLESCKVRIVIGEFTARYESEYEHPPEWVTVVPAMELYITGWMRYVAGADWIR